MPRLPVPALLIGFAETVRDIAAASGRLEKADRLGAFLDELDDADLARAARFAAGRVFPLADRRRVNVGTAAALAALSEASGQPPGALRALLVRLGDAGDVAEHVLPARAEPSGFTLADTEALGAALAETSGSKARTALLVGALARLAPLEARAVVKLVAGDLRMGMLAGGVEAALARHFGRDAATLRRAAMLTGDLGETAVLARYERLAEARLRLFAPLALMLASPAQDAEDAARQLPAPFLAEDKFDGIRAQVHVAPEAEARHALPPGVPPEDLHGVVVQTERGPVRVALFSRTLDPLADAFPDLLAPLAACALPGGLLLDGEIVPTDPATGGVAPFQQLQTRLGRRRPSAAVMAAAPVSFVAFDVLARGGEELLDAPLSERLRALAALGLPLSDAPGRYVVRRSRAEEVLEADVLDRLFEAARARGNEGLMLKHPAAPYRPGRRGRGWLKLKRALATLDVVVTAVEVGSGARRHLLSDYTFAVRASEDDPALLNIGKAYSGLTDAELVRLTAWFKAHTRQTFAHGRVRTVEPRIVLEVAFDRVQPSRRHKSGYALRFPRIVRLREDKRPEDIDTLDAVRALAGA
ncbi:MAG: ATP-dependent DNA ligase [Rubricoccaceae bacterium]